MSIEIVPMEEAHLDMVSALENECFVIPWTRKAFADELKDTKMKIYFVAVENGAVLGYAGMWHIVNEGHITNVAVAEAQRKRGIGDLLVKRLVEAARALEMIGLTLEVRISNYNAQRLYTRNGFKPDGIRKNYYEDTREDAVIMWLEFDAEAGD